MENTNLKNAAMEELNRENQNTVSMEPVDAAKERVPGFLLTRFLREVLSNLTSMANGSGERVVRWTDLLEYGVANLTEEDLKRIYETRTMLKTSPS